MINELEFLDEFTEYLKGKGYSSENLIREYRAGKYHFDFVAIDPNLRSPVAIFEIQKKVNSRVFHEKWRKLLEHRKEFLPLVPSLFIVNFNAETEKFDVYEVSEKYDEGVYRQGFHHADIPEAIPLSEAPSFQSIQNSAITNSIQNTKTSQKKVFDAFQIVCWISAVLVFILFLLKLAGKVDIDSTELSLLGVCIALVIIPFASKLKILGVEFERLTETKKEH